MGLARPTRALIVVVKRAYPACRAGSPIETNAGGQFGHLRIVHVHELLPLVVLEVINAERGLRILGHPFFETGVVVKALQSQYQSSLTHDRLPFAKYDLPCSPLGAVRDPSRLWPLDHLLRGVSKRGATGRVQSQTALQTQRHAGLNGKKIPYYITRPEPGRFPRSTARHKTRRAFGL